VILVSCDKKSQEKRLRGRGLDTRQIERRLASQYSEREKREKIQARIQETNQGRLWFLDASDTTPEQEFSRVFDEVLDFFGLDRS
jgi:dephospho-CoA kinase